MSQHLFRIEFNHDRVEPRPGVERQKPGVRFIVAPEQFYVEAWANNIKWMWGDHTFEIVNLGLVDKIITAEDRP